MKLSDLGLKVKPETHYFEGGYVSFHTTDHVLFYRITLVNPKQKANLDCGEVKDKQHLENILRVKSIQEAIHA